MGQCGSNPAPPATTDAQPVHEGVALDVQCLPRGLSASCGEDLSIVMYDWTTSAVLARLLGHSKVVNKIAWSESADGVRLWSCSRDLTIKEWDISNQTIRAEASNAHELNITALGVTTDQTQLFSGSRDCSVKLWDASRLQLVTETTTARNLVTCMKCLNDDPMVVQGSEDLTLRVWDARAMKSPAATLTGYTFFPLCVDVTQDNHYAVTGSKGFNGSGCEVRVWDLRMRKQLQLLEGHQQDVTGCKITDDGRVVTACKDGTIGLWHLHSDEHFLFSDAKPCMFSAIDLALGDDASPYGMIGSTYGGALLKMAISATDIPNLMVTQSAGWLIERAESAIVND